MVAPDERQFLRDIVKLTGVKPEVIALPEGYDEPSREEVAPRIYGQKPKRYGAKPTGGRNKNKHSVRKGRPSGNRGGGERSGGPKKGGPKHWNNASKSFKRRQKRKTEA